MKASEMSFLEQLEDRARQQARIESSSPLPEGIRPLAALLGEKPWQVILLSSFVWSVVVTILIYPIVLRLFEQGVLSWLLR